MKIVYDEFYGTLSYAQRAAYRKYNITPFEHDALEKHFGGNEHKFISDYVVANALAHKGMFRIDDLW